jgi:hypothetical protein
MLSTILIILLILFLIGGIPTGGYGYGNGAHISLGTVLVVVILLALFGVIH